MSMERTMAGMSEQEVLRRCERLRAKGTPEEELSQVLTELSRLSPLEWSASTRSALIRAVGTLLPWEHAPLRRRALQFLTEWGSPEAYEEIASFIERCEAEEVGMGTIEWFARVVRGGREGTSLAQTAFAEVAVNPARPDRLRGTALTGLLFLAGRLTEEEWQRARREISQMAVPWGWVQGYLRVLPD